MARRRHGLTLRRLSRLRRPLLVASWSPACRAARALLQRPADEVRRRRVDGWSHRTLDPGAGGRLFFDCTSRADVRTGTMDQRERLLYHQIHPLKLLADGAAELVSLPLFWQRRPRAALVAHFLAPVVASLAVLQWADLEPYARSAFGRYVARSMTPRMQALRLVGDLVMVAGAWRRRWSVILAGALLVLFAWLRGKLSSPWSAMRGSPAPVEPSD